MSTKLDVTGGINMQLGKISMETPSAPPPKPTPKRVEPEDPAMVLTFADLERIGKQLGRNVTSSATFYEAIEALNTVSVEGVKVSLEPGLLRRLKSRCLKNTPFPKFLSEVVVRQLHDYAGW